MMENSKLVLMIIILMCSFGTMRVASDADLGDYLGSMLGGSSVTCMEKMLPCQPYLTPGPVPPPANCCTPIKDLIANDTKCICDTFNNPLVRGSLNVSIDDIMKLPKACNQTFDIAVCKKSDATGGDPKTTDTKSTASAKPTSLDSSTPADSDLDSDSPPDSDSSPDSDSKPSGANGNFYSLPGRKYIISLAFFVVFILSVY